MNRKLFTLRAGVAICLCLVSSFFENQVHGQLHSDFEFTIVSSSKNSPYRAYGNFASINNLGWVAYLASHDNGSGSVIEIGNGNVTEVFVDTGNSSFFSLSSGPAINDSNQVAFTGFLAGSRRRIWRADGGSIVNIDSAGDGSGAFTTQNSISNSGTVAWGSSISPSRYGIYAGDGHSVTEYLGESASIISAADPILNNLNQAVFHAQEAGTGRYKILVADENRITEIVSSDNWLLSGPATMNDRMDVLFLGTNPSGQTGIHLWDGNGFHVIADNSGEFDSFISDYGSSYAINNHGEVVFFGRTNDGGSGIFVGNNPAEDRLIGSGDIFDGEKITEVVLGRLGLNENGQIAFLALTESGNQYVIRADRIAKVPEPVTFALFVIPALIFAAWKRYHHDRSPTTCAVKALTS